MQKYLFSLFVLFLSCSKDVTTLQTKFSGIISLNTNLSASEPFSNYTAEYQTAFNSGARGAQTAAPWGSLNPTGTTYDFAALSNSFFGLGTLKNIGFEAIFLNIPIIAIDKRSMPADIIGLAFDDPTVKSRFRLLIDAIKDQLNDKVKYVAFGNEVDTYFATRPTEWTAYKSLIDDARSYLKTLKPNIQVAVTTTFTGASSSFPVQVSTLNSNMDVIALTYYPINNNFIPLDPTTVKDDVAKMIALAGGKPLVMQEWGYPSSSVLTSSEKKQTDFISNSFTQLKENGASVFPFVSFFKYRDWNANHVQTLTGQTVGQNFYEFMSSLGLKKNDGTSKSAFQIIEMELKK